MIKISIFGKKLIRINFKNRFESISKIDSNQFQKSIFWQKYRFVTKISICDKNFYLWQKFRFVTKISICDKKFLFVTKISICDKKFYLWQKVLFVTKSSICDKNFYLWQKFLFMTKIFDLWQIFNKYLDSK